MEYLCTITFRSDYDYAFFQLRRESSTVPASFTMDSLELSPSFRALAEELDNPKMKPSDTQMRQIERELDLIGGECRLRGSP